jgi:hypothetical protein
MSPLPTPPHTCSNDNEKSYLQRRWMVLRTVKVYGEDSDKWINDKVSRDLMREDLVGNFLKSNIGYYSIFIYLK